MPTSRYTKLYCGQKTVSTRCLTWRAKQTDELGRRSVQNLERPRWRRGKDFIRTGLVPLKR